jgi:hypothetical protein
MSDVLEKPMSRQKRWQAKKKSEGNCPCCGRPANRLAYCLECAVKKREARRRRIGSKRRYRGSLTYKLQKDAKNGQ